MILIILINFTQKFVLCYNSQDIVTLYCNRQSKTSIQFMRSHAPAMLPSDSSAATVGSLLRS